MGQTGLCLLALWTATSSHSFQEAVAGWWNWKGFVHQSLLRLTHPPTSPQLYLLQHENRTQHFILMLKHPSDVAPPSFQTLYMWRFYFQEKYHLWCHWKAPFQTLLYFKWNYVWWRVPLASSRWSQPALESIVRTGSGQNILRTSRLSQVWWHSAIIPVPRRMRQGHFKFRLCLKKGRRRRKRKRREKRSKEVKYGGTHQ